MLALICWIVLSDRSFPEGKTMTDKMVGVTEQVDNALREVLGYLPPDDEDLTGSIDSMQKLELLVLLEQNLAIPFQDEALGADWWASRSGIIGYVESARAQVGSS
ncbi:hypothetical protein C6W10_35850 [Plantactinospora sp. BB1]|nr:hypothetical protein C6W10_35850 [Plantactinospora sp. BB1]